MRTLTEVENDIRMVEQDIDFMNDRLYALEDNLNVLEDERVYVEDYEAAQRECQTLRGYSGWIETGNIQDEYETDDTCPGCGDSGEAP